MRIRGLRVTDLAAIREADVQLGPGLNVLYGPNDLGKSTLAEAIRLALLLPHTSTHIEDYVPWLGGQDPVVELTFESEPHRIWRVRKEFRKGGSATLEASNNGRDFDEVERARKVDGALREILRWGIAEPGGSGGGKGLPTSFLATVLLSTQADVGAVLHDSLSGDAIGTGKERIAAALQAVAQDPLFVALLRATQARRDQAYTDKGAKKTAKGSVFKEAADRLREVRDERDRLQKVVEESEGVERHLQELTAKRSQREEAFALAAERAKVLEQFARDAAALSASEKELRGARESVERIKAMDVDLDACTRRLKDLALSLADSEEALTKAQQRSADARRALEEAEKAANADGSDKSARDTIARQALELRRTHAEQAVQDAKRRVDAALGAQRLVDAAKAAEVELQTQHAAAQAARGLRADALAKEELATEQLRTLDLIELALEVRAAEAALAAARANAEQEASLRRRIDSRARERDDLAARRAKLPPQPTASLPSMRRLENDLAAARGALNVGLAVTVTLQRPLTVRILRDGTAPQTTNSAEAVEVEANSQVDVEIDDFAQIRILGGRRDAQEVVRNLEERWGNEVAPVLTAAGVADLDALAASLDELRALDAALNLTTSELGSLQEQLASLFDSSEQLSTATLRLEVSKEALGVTSPASLLSGLAVSGSDPRGEVRGRRQKYLVALEAAQIIAAGFSSDVTLAEERCRTSKESLEAAIILRDLELARYPEQLSIELAAAESAATAASDEQARVAADLESLERLVSERTVHLDAAISGARAAVDRALDLLEAAEAARTILLKENAAEGGRLDALRQQRTQHDLEKAESSLREASQRHGVLPVPSEMVAETDLVAARHTAAAAKADLERIVSDIHKAQGALEQVGGAVARERLRDAVEAYHLAERNERDIEAEFDAWLLLLEQMKAADAAQASNLGQVLAPAIARKFEALTQKRYDGVQLTPHLGTEGIVVRGTLRPTERLSVGTREQLSTLYRLSLAEYLGTALVLDDQLVQSDDTRMDWFRGLLAEKARAFQIMVFTCRPSDYLEASAFVPKGKAFQKDTDGGFVRAIDLARAVQRR